MSLSVFDESSTILQIAGHTPSKFHVKHSCWSGPSICVDRNSSVGIATDYELDGPGIESRWGARFSAHVQTGTGAHPASCTMGTGSFPGVKNGRGVTLTPHPFLVPWSWKGRAIPLLPLWAVRPVQSLSQGPLSVPGEWLLCTVIWGYISVRCELMAPAVCSKCRSFRLG